MSDMCAPEWRIKSMETQYSNEINRLARLLAHVDPVKQPRRWANLKAALDRQRRFASEHRKWMGGGSVL